MLEALGKEIESFIRLTKVSVVAEAVHAFGSDAAYEWPWDNKMILLRTVSWSLSQVIHCDGEWRDSAVECLPNTPRKMEYKGEFFFHVVKAVYQEQVNQPQRPNQWMQISGDYLETKASPLRQTMAEISPAFLMGHVCLGWKGSALS